MEQAQYLAMTNTPESDTMKTLTQISEENGADIIIFDLDGSELKEAGISFENEAQLLATFNAWSAQQEGWININDRLPDDGAMVNIFVPNYGQCTGYMSKNVHNTTWWCRAMNQNVHPTHWMPLAASPLKG